MWSPLMHTLVGRYPLGRITFRLPPALVLALTMPLTAQAASFDSGSNGSDGALILTTPGTVHFDPATLGLDVDGDSVVPVLVAHAQAGGAAVSSG